jgi:UDP-N-acetylglucosamine 2-epimerase
MRIVSIVGARPQFIKAAPVCRAVRERHEEILVHSGQHFDHAMSDVFFEELGIPRPDYNLGVGGGGHGRMTGEMLGLLEELLVELEPDWVLVYGDTNTTLAGALAAAKLNIPLAHVEAGLRSFNRSMPEEINRVVTDHVSTLLLCPTDTAVTNLAAEGITAGVHQVGDVMLDAARITAEKVDKDEVLGRYGLEDDGYYLATVHRAATSDDRQQLASVLRAFAALDAPVVFAVHPRTRKNVEAFGLDVLLDAPNIRAVPPIPYLETSGLLRGARKLLTDSGGMQKEAYFFGVPCVTLRDETEWVETVESGWNVVVGTEETAIANAAVATAPTAERPAFYGTGYAADKIASLLG